MEIVWKNEFFSPELLPHQIKIVELITKISKDMEDQVSKLKSTDLLWAVHKMELERIQYIITSYLRCRIKKIEKFTKVLLEEENEKQLMTTDERQYAEKYIKLIANVFEKNLFEKLSPDLLKICKSTSHKEIVEPNVESHVFVRSNISATMIIKHEDKEYYEEMDMNPGSFYILRYKHISKSLLLGDFELI